MNYNKMIQWVGTHHVGVSSRTMWCALMGIAKDGTESHSGFDVPGDASDFSRCYDLVKFCEVGKHELQMVVDAFPFYNLLSKNGTTLLLHMIKKTIDVFLTSFTAGTMK